MKMNLSVVMQTIDKMSAPLKKITSAQSKYSKEIAQIKKQSEALSSNQALISQYRKTGAETAKTRAKFNAAQQKLAVLSDKMKSAKKPSQALQLQMKKQQDVVNTLKTTQTAYIKALTKTSNKMKSAGIDVKRLSSEEKRLSKEYRQRMTLIDKLVKKETRLQHIRAKLGKFKLPNIGGAMAGKMAGVLGAVSLGGLFSTVNSSAAEMDKLSKAAQNLNMPVEELQAMQSQAEHAGISTDSMTEAMSRFTKRLGVLQTTGEGAMGSFLKKGKSPLYAELKNAANTEQAYGKILTVFSKLKTNQQQMAFADAMFGKDGRKMLIMLRDGTAGLTDARKKFNDLGGGVKTDDAKKAEAYNDALQKVQESIRSMKFAALAPIMEKMTVIFTDFSNKFKNAQWRTEVIEKVKNIVTSLFMAFKLLGNGLLFFSQNMPEVIACLALFKIGMFALNAAMFANPVALIAAGLAAFVVVVGYGINALGGWNAIWGAICNTMKSAWQTIKDVGAFIALIFIPIIDTISGAFNRVSAGVHGAIGLIKRNLLTIPRAIMKMLSLIPNQLLPDGWGEGIKSAQQKLEAFNNELKGKAKANIEYAIKGPHEFAQVTDKRLSLNSHGDNHNDVVARKLEGIRSGLKKSEKLRPQTSRITPITQYHYGTAKPEHIETHEKLEVVREKIKESQQSLQVNNESKETHEKLEVVREKIKESQQNKQTNQFVQETARSPIAQNKGYGGMLRHPTVQSKSQVDVRIKSDKPVEIVKAESDKHTDVNVDTFDFNWSF